MNEAALDVLPDAGKTSREAAHHAVFAAELADEAIYILRETAAQFERPAILFSGGKDSIVVTHLAVKAFAPAESPSRCSTLTPGTTFRRPFHFAINSLNRSA